VRREDFISSGMFQIA
jgi:hypothetical protein